MDRRTFGYARVSSTCQNLDRQIIQLKKYVPEENIIVDKISGKDLNRPGYNALKGAMGLRRGDILYIISIDRLSRSKQDIKTELEWFKNSGIELRILDLPTTMIDLPDGQEWIRDMINNIIIEVMSSIAEQERMTIRKRQREGIDAAKAQGRNLGRPCVKKPDNWDEVIAEWKSDKITAKVAMERVGMKKSSFYKFVKKK